MGYIQFQKNQIMQLSINDKTQWLLWVIVGLLFLLSRFIVYDPSFIPGNFLLEKTQLYLRSYLK